MRPYVISLCRMVSDIYKVVIYWVMLPVFILLPAVGMTSASLEGLFEEMSVAKIQPYNEGALLAGSRYGQFTIMDLTKSQNLNPSFAHKGILSLGRGTVVDIVQVDNDWIAIGELNHENVIIRFDRTGTLAPDFGLGGINILDTDASLLISDNTNQKVIVISADHNRVLWQSLDPGTGHELGRTPFSSSPHSHFKFWHIPKVVKSFDNAWLLGVARNNGLYQTYSLLVIQGDCGSDTGCTSECLELRGFQQLLNIDRDKEFIYALGVAANGKQWIDQYAVAADHRITDKNQQPAVSFLLTVNSLSVALLNQGKILTAGHYEGTTVIREQRLSGSKLITSDQSARSEKLLQLPSTVSIELISADDKNIWFVGLEAGKHFVGRLDTLLPDDIAEYNNSDSDQSDSLPHRQRRQARDCGTIDDATIICTSGADCSINNGVSFVTGITNDINTFISTDIATEIDTTIDTQIDSLINIATDIETTIRITVDTTVIVQTRINFENEITTELSGEAGTLKASLDGNFIIDNQIATLEAEADLSIQTSLGLFTRFEGLSANLTTLIKTDADIEAEVTGVRTSLIGNTAAAGSGGMLGGIIAGTIIGVSCCSMRAVMGTILLIAISKAKSACITVVCGPLGVLWQCCHR